MVRRAFAIAGLAVAALVVALVTAAVSNGPALGHQHASSGPTLFLPPPGSVRRGSTANGTDSGVPQWFTIGMTVLLALYVVGLAVLTILSRRAEAVEDEELELLQAEPDPEGRWPTALAVDLGSAAEQQLARLHEGSPRNAIVACWMGLQAATRGAGMPELPWETAEEYVVRAMQRLALDRIAVTELSRLYREARFSEHVMVEPQRQRAGAALRVLADQLAHQLAERRTAVVAPGPADGTGSTRGRQAP